MKRLLIALLLLLAAPAWAQQGWIPDNLGQDYTLDIKHYPIDSSVQLALMSGPMLGCGGSAAAPSTFCSSATATPNTTGVFCEDFEGETECYSGYSSNCRAAWGAPTGTPDFDYGTAIDGTYSIKAYAYTQNEDVRTKRTFTESAGSTYYGYFKMTVVNMPASNTSKEVVRLWSGNGASVLANIFLEKTAGGNFISVLATGGTRVLTTATTSESTTYNVWFKTVVGTGANAEAHVAFSTGTTRPTDGDAGYAKSTNGTSTATLDAFGVYVDNSQVAQCNDIIIDNIFIDDAEITGVPN